MRIPALTLVLLLVALTGCPPPAGQAPRSRREALQRVNGNLRELHRPLQCKALVSFSFRDADGRRQRFIGHEARLIYQAPRYLLFDVDQALAGRIAQFGSNDERYWVWVEPEVNKMWWGHWEQADLGHVRRLPVPPNELFDALMLRPLPETLAGSPLPILRLEGDDHRLLFLRLDAGGTTTGLREVRLDSHPPYMPVEMIDRLPDGQIAMHARLGNYRPVGDDGPWTPRRYVVNWPLTEAEMRLDILRARFRDEELPVEVFEFPRTWSGTIEQVDQADAPGMTGSTGS
jgi:hypothetical protein